MTWRQSPIKYTYCTRVILYLSANRSRYIPYFIQYVIFISACSIPEQILGYLHTSYYVQLWMYALVKHDILCFEEIRDKYILLFGLFHTNLVSARSTKLKKNPNFKNNYPVNWKKKKSEKETESVLYFQ